MKKWKVVIPVIVVALFAAWYAFRPERTVEPNRSSAADHRRAVYGWLQLGASVRGTGRQEGWHEVLDWRIG